MYLPDKKCIYQISMWPENNTVRSVLALHTAYMNLIPGTPYGSVSNCRSVP